MTDKAKRDFAQESIDVSKLFDNLKNKYQCLKDTSFMSSTDYFETKTIVFNMNPIDWVEYDENESQQAVGSIIVAFKKNKRLDIRLSHFVSRKAMIIDEFSRKCMIIHLGKFNAQQVELAIKTFLM